MKRRGKLIGAVMLLLVLALGMGWSYAWFTSSGAGDQPVPMGRLKVELDYDEDVEDETGFELENTGDLAAYVRVGYTFVYKNDENRELLKDVSDVAVGDGVLTADNPVRGALTSITETASGYHYARVLLFPLNAEDRYYRLEPGEVIHASFPVSGNTAGEGERLTVTWVAEAIQCSEGALTSAQAYGWNPAMA